VLDPLMQKHLRDERNDVNPILSGGSLLSRDMQLHRAGER
jgi:hypothetical protein